ncbi:hypothetical protein PIB30_059138 [Stylosanthes scabra]|uniref:Uncharacterized protein n=1 Tax=Stylosanthes scabra TaxID=79078 RepID=A0ABU6WK17_9FABA|nr:hypothetical protein [Stylosanthes scabra]
MLIVDRMRNRVQLRLAKGYCSAYIAEGLVALAKLYKLFSSGTIKLRFIPNTVFHAIKVRDRNMRTQPILYRNLHAMLVQPSSFKEKQPSKKEIFFSNVEDIQRITYRRPLKLNSNIFRSKLEQQVGADDVSNDFSNKGNPVSSPSQAHEWVQSRNSNAARSYTRPSARSRKLKIGITIAEKRPEHRGRGWFRKPFPPHWRLRVVELENFRQSGWT